MTVKRFLLYAVVKLAQALLGKVDWDAVLAAVTKEAEDSTSTKTGEEKRAAVRLKLREIESNASTTLLNYAIEAAALWIKYKI